LRSGNQVSLTIAPDKAGYNQIHVQYSDASGKPVDIASSVQIEFNLPAQGVGPITRDAPKAGPGHFLVEGSELSIPGTWQIALLARTSEFDLERTTFQAKVAPCPPSHRGAPHQCPPRPDRGPRPARRSPVTLSRATSLVEPSTSCGR
jgi:hypothetical protein